MKGLLTSFILVVVLVLVGCQSSKAPFDKSWKPEDVTLVK
jgi:hypothetical protein